MGLFGDKDDPAEMLEIANEVALNIKSLYEEIKGGNPRPLASIEDQDMIDYEYLRSYLRRGNIQGIARDEYGIQPPSAEEQAAVDPLLKPSGITYLELHAMSQEIFRYKASEAWKEMKQSPHPDETMYIYGTLHYNLNNLGMERDSDELLKLLDTDKGAFAQIDKAHALTEIHEILSEAGASAQRSARREIEKSENNIENIGSEFYSKMVDRHIGVEKEVDIIMKQSGLTHADVDFYMEAKMGFSKDGIPTPVSRPQ